MEQAKSWLGLLAIIFGLSLAGDLYFWYEHSLLKKVFWVHEPNASFKQGGAAFDNTSSESGIWISGKDYDLMRRGHPNWLSSALVLLALIQIYRYLNKTMSTPISIATGKPGQPKPGNLPSSDG